MKKIEYMTPESKVFKVMPRRAVLLNTSDGNTPGIGGEGDDEEAG